MTDVFNWSLNRAYVAFLLHHVVLVFAIILSRQTGWTGYNIYHKSELKLHIYIAGTLGCVFIDNETHESGVTKCTTGEAWSAFSWHHSSVFHCQWTHNQVFLLLSHMLI